MDTVRYRSTAFDRIVDEFKGFATRLSFHDVAFIPISALHGDNVVDPSGAMPWFAGTTLMYHLDHVHIASDRNLIDARFPVQCAIRDAARELRGYAGRMESGVLRRGDEVVVLPSARQTRINSILTPEGSVDEAYPPLPVVITLQDEFPVTRGDVICRPENMPAVSRSLDAKVCWMSDRPLLPGARYLLKHTTQTVNARVDAILYRIDVNHLRRDLTGELACNDIGRVRLRTGDAVLADTYDRSRAMGSFILIDPVSNETVGGGIIDNVRA
jgi:bifunctional enzyme CysN/CysC